MRSLSASSMTFAVIPSGPGVPLLLPKVSSISFSDIPVPYLTHIDIVDAGLEVLEQDQIKSATVESLRFMNNKIKIIDNNMFA